MKRGNLAAGKGRGEGTARLPLPYGRLHYMVDCHSKAVAIIVYAQQKVSQTDDPLSMTLSNLEIAREVRARPPK